MPAGTVVASGNLISPGGQQGGPAWTLSAASFTIPTVGSSATMTVIDSSWATVGEYVWVQSSPTVADCLQVTAKTPTSITLLNPPTAGMQVSGDANNKATLGSDSLILVRGTAAGVAATTHAQTVSGDDPQLTNARSPLAHGSGHVSTGVDPIGLFSITSSTSGLVPGTAVGDPTQYLSGNRSWSTPSLNNLTSGAWTPFTILIVPGTGTITAQTSFSTYLLMGKTCFVNFYVQVTNIGTASGAAISLANFPAPFKNAMTFTFRETAITGLIYACQVSPGATGGQFLTYNNGGATWANNMAFSGFVVYETT